MDTNFPNQKRALRRGWFGFIFAVLACVMLLFALIASAQPAHTKTIQAPQLVAEEFFGWYLTGLASDEDPLTSDRQKLAIYVSKALIKDLDRQRNRDKVIAEDYFLKSQDYLDEWQTARHVSRPFRRGDTTIVQMKLGTNPTNLHTLDVYLIREDGAWKIRRVTLPKP